jgi:hypothetical protein
MSDKRGISALLLSRTLSIRYETAWFMLHKIRQAMETREDQYQLQGLIEMDDGYFGGVDHGRAGRGVETPRVIVAVGVNKRRPSYAKMGVVQRISKEEIADFACRTCIREALIKTDGLIAYKVLEKHGFRSGRQAASRRSCGIPICAYPDLQRQGLADRDFSRWSPAQVPSRLSQ